MEIIQYHNQSDSALKNVETVNSLHNISDSSVSVVFDNENYNNREDIRDDFKMPAFYWNAASHDRLNVPDKISKIMEESSCNHLIWISKENVEAKPIRLTWLYSHELRHFLQAQDIHIYFEIEKGLRRVHEEENFGGNGTQLEIPMELDSEIFAKNTVKSLYSEIEYQRYIEDEIKREGAKKYYERLNYLQSALCL